MCGIVGSLSRRGRRGFADAVESMWHRGPDAGRAEEFEIAGWSVSLGHRRLSIIDLNTVANQPLTSRCGNFVIIFNGEIYNHNELRGHLSNRGCQFKTRSDTEVLLEGIALEGLSFLERLNGMFAFAVLDKAGNRLILARDPFGIKPLYLMRTDDGGLSFASEFDALSLASGAALEPDPDCISEFLLNGFLYEPSSGISKVMKVPPGCAYDVDVSTMQMSLHRFHDPLAGPDIDASFDELLEAQMALEVEADVRVGIFFSGGIDSSTLLAAAPPGSEALFIDYGEAQGDAFYADSIAALLNSPLQRIQHRLRDTDQASILDEFSQVASGTDEPISDYTYVATRIISRYAREAGFKVMLSGMGGDELFAGYPRHAAARYWDSLRPVRKPLGAGASLLRHVPGWAKRADRLSWFLSAPDFAQAYTGLVGYFSLDEVEAMTGSCRGGALALDRLRVILRPVQDESTLRQAMYLDRYGFLAHNLSITDRASMAERIEVRVPLLSEKLERHSRTLPDDKLIRRRNGKLPLKTYLDSRLPEKLVHRPKIGFNPPLDGRIKKLGRGICKELVTSGAITSFVDPQISGRWVDAHFDGQGNHTYRIWQLIYLALWLEQFKNKARNIL